MNATCLRAHLATRRSHGPTVRCKLGASFVGSAIAATIGAGACILDAEAAQLRLVATPEWNRFCYFREGQRFASHDPDAAIAHFVEIKTFNTVIYTANNISNSVHPD
jgi:hypothetical protein